MTCARTAIRLPSQRQVHSAFTLVELLVVVAIITALMALLLPALGMARNRAKTVSCASNQRQVGVAVAGYVNDNRAYPYLASSIPNAFNSSGGRPFYLDLMVPYLIGGYYTNSFSTATTNRWYGLIRCPANPAGWTFPSSFFSTSYPFNTDLFPATMCFEGGWVCSYGNPAFWNHQVVPSDIQHPANALMIGEWPVDSAPSSNDFPWLAYSGGHASSAPYCDSSASGGGDGWAGICGVTVTNYYWTDYTINYGPAYATSFVWLRPDCNENVATFHNLNMNCLYVDGHVGQVSQFTLGNYACEYFNPANPPRTAAMPGPAYYGPNDSPGGWFFTDGKQSGGPEQWYTYQLPNNGQ